MWGVNAVNGVIDIITRPATVTQGALVTAGSGSANRGFTGMRYGSRIGRSAWLKLTWRSEN